MRRKRNPVEHCRTLTVDYGDVSVLVVFRQGDGGTRDGRHSSDRPAAVCAVKVAGCGPRFVAGASCASTCQSPSSHSSEPTGHTVGEAEGIPRAVAAVRLVDPLHHRDLGGDAVVLTRQDHGLEEHGIPLLISYKHMHPRARVWEDHCGSTGR